MRKTKRKRKRKGRGERKGKGRKEEEEDEEGEEGPDYIPQRTNTCPYQTAIALRLISKNFIIRQIMRYRLSFFPWTKIPVCSLSVPDECL